MSKKRNLIFLSLLVSGILLLTGCFLDPPATEGILKGQVILPEGFIKNKDLTGQAFPDATVNIIDLTSSEIIATTVTDTDGNYQVFVPPGGPYLLEAVKDGVSVQQVTPSVEVGIEYDLGIADCTTTTVALIARAMLAEGENLININCSDIIVNTNFDKVSSVVCSIIKDGGDPTIASEVFQAIEDYLYPPPSQSTQSTTPTYTVTYDGNSNTGGFVPTDANTYESGEEVIVLGNSGSMEKVQDGIFLLFNGWNISANGSGTCYTPSDTFSMGSSDITLYAQWEVIGATGPAGGLVFYDKGAVSDGWRYLEAAPVDQSTGIQWFNGINIITDATETAPGTGPANTIKIINLQGEITTDYAAGLARAYSGGSYNDWFLPSKDELNQMYTNLHNISTPVGGFADVSYWSSSESAAGRAWFMNFFGGQFDEAKSFTLHVRAARAFRSTAPAYIVNYHANEATDGTIPSDPYHYEESETVKVLDNSGSLVKDGYLFDGWNNEADGSGTDYDPDDLITIGNDDMTLYAKWVATIDIAAVPGVTAPVTASIPVTTITETSQYTGTVEWAPDHSSFAGSTVYTATITLTPKTGFTLTGVTEDFFTVAGADSVSNSVDSGLITAVFPETATVGIGDSYGGGKIAYILQSGEPGYVEGEQHGLIAATSDQASDEVAWSNITNTLAGTGTAIGTGQQNTIYIVNQAGCTSGAAYLCYHLEEGGYDDWYLPSKDELGKLYYSASTVGGFETAWYWSSSESGASDAYLCRILYSSSPEFPIAGKGNDFCNHVRAVRSF